MILKLKDKKDLSIYLINLIQIWNEQKRNIRWVAKYHFFDLTACLSIKLKFQSMMMWLFSAVILSGFTLNASSDLFTLFLTNT